MTESVVGGPLPGVSGAWRRLSANPGFRRLWLSQFVSGVGDWLVIGFLMPLVSSLSGDSSFAVAGIMIAKIIPALFLSSVTGALVDRVDRRRLMIVCDLVRGCLALGLLVTNSLPIIYAVVLLMEGASLFFVPAKNALIPRMVSEDDLAAANGLSYTTQQASMLVGLGASGAILAGFERVVRGVLDANLPIVSNLVGLFAPELLGPRAGVFVDSLTFFVSATAIAGMHVISKAERGDARLSLSLVGRDIVDSFKFLREHRELRGLLGAVALAILGGGTIIPVGLTYISKLSGGVPILEDVPALRALVAAPQTFILLFLALGLVVGALTVARLTRLFAIRTLFAGSIAAFGLAMLGFATVNRYWLAGVFAVLAGACIATLSVSGNTYVARTTEDALRGRVFTALEAVIRVSLLLSMIVMAPLGDLVSRVVRGYVVSQGMLVEQALLTGPRVTLQLASVIVFAAALYAVVALRSSSGDVGGEAA